MHKKAGADHLFCQNLPITLMKVCECCM